MLVTNNSLGEVQVLEIERRGAENSYIYCIIKKKTKSA